MKKMFVITLFFVFLFSFAVAEDTKADTAVQMTYIVKMPDVIREGKYTGELLDGVPHGFGVFATQNSEGIAWHYIGDWQNGQMTGQGGYYWDDGQSFVGTFEANDMVCGYQHIAPSQNIWIDYRPNDHGCYEAIEYRMDETILFEGCINAKTGLYHNGTVYTKDGKVFFSGEIGDGFDWDLIYVE